MAYTTKQSDNSTHNRIVCLSHVQCVERWSVSADQLEACMRYTLQARLSPAWNVVGRHLIRGTIIGTACGAGSMQLSGVRPSVCLSVPWQQRTSLDAVRSLAGCGCTAPQHGAQQQMFTVDGRACYCRYRRGLFPPDTPGCDRSGWRGRGSLLTLPSLQGVPRTNCALRIKKCAPRISSGIYFLS